MLKLEGDVYRAVYRETTVRYNLEVGDVVHGVCVGEDVVSSGGL